MLNLNIRTISADDKYIITNYHPLKRKFYAIALNAYEKKNIQAKVMGKALNIILEFCEKSNVHDIKETEEFLNDLNWIVAAEFKKTQTVHNGLSLGLMFVNDNNVLVTRCGKVLIGKIDKQNKLTEIGCTWEHFVVKAKDKMYLLGAQSADFYPKVFSYNLEYGEKILLLDTNNSELFKKCLEKEVYFKNNNNDTLLFLEKDNISVDKKFGFSKLKIWK